MATLTTPPVLFVHVGPMRHGVTRYGALLARAGSHVTAAPNICLVRATDQERLADACDTHRPAVCHFHFTDQLYGPDPLTAAARFGSLVDCIGRAASVATIHDVPPPDGEGAEPRRTAYRSVVERADAVIVSSWHEADRLRAFTGIAATVIPHYIEARPRCRSGLQRPSIGVLGFIYPGKGHDAVIVSASGQPIVEVVAIGGPAPRHTSLVAELRNTARRVGVRLEVEGWVAEHQLDSHLAGTTVPVVPNEDVSASGSLATWLGAHRRPLVRSGPYVHELAARAPGCMTVYDARDPESLTAAISTSLGDPTSTWQDCVPDDLRPERIAHHHSSLFADVA